MTTAIMVDREALAVIVLLAQDVQSECRGIASLAFAIDNVVAGAGIFRDDE